MEQIYLEFSCWGILGFGETLAWSGKKAERLDNKVFVSVCSVNLFSQKYRLQNDKIITSIQLPDYPSIHIFTISLEK